MLSTTSLRQSHDAVLVQTLSEKHVPADLTDWHILIVGEAGFSMLNFYSKRVGGLQGVDLSLFADRINAMDEAGSLHPRAPISAIPRRFFRDHEYDLDPSVLDDFRRCVTEFIEANRTVIRATRILVDLRVSPSPIPRRYVRAVQEDFRASDDDGLVVTVLIIA